MIRESALFLGIFLAGIVVQSYAQNVPLTVKRDISSQLSCGGSQYDDITAVRVGPGKRGYLGQCVLGGNAILWEKTANGIRKIFSEERQMNGGVYLSKRVHNGYYEVTWVAYGATYWYETTYRWNGNRFVSHQGKACDVNSKGKRVNCKPS